jgi:hypothetical protein
VVTQKHPYFRDLECTDVERMEEAAHCDWICSFFDQCFTDLGEWTMVMVGNIDVEVMLPLLEKFLGSVTGAGGDSEEAGGAVGAAEGIPLAVQSEKPPHEDGDGSARAAVAAHKVRADCQPLGVQFPPTAVDVRLERPMVQALRSRAYISLPLTVKRTKGSLIALRSLFRLKLAASVLEKQLRETLRFDKGGVYGVSVGSSYENAEPDPDTPLTGTMSISFDCDPARQEELIASTLAELSRLRVEGVKAEIVTSMLEVFKRDFEESVRTNSYWIGESLLPTVAESSPLVKLPCPALPAC